jgi:hypothetical protein
MRNKRKKRKKKKKKRKGKLKWGKKLDEKHE